MQNKFAGMKPNCCVLTPITQITTLFTPATTSPPHIFLPTSTVDRTVSAHDSVSIRNMTATSSAPSLRAARHKTP